ncbi:MAG: hypothetical protein IKN81_04800 [Oscillospiraceae bacterium]|nr:hypothetical protein [Oscillospiraceae bacterium]
MRKNHWIARLAGLLLISYTLLVVGVMAAGTAGTQSDPLVTLSYLNDTFLSQLLGKVDERLAARDKELTDKLNAQVQVDTKALAEQYGGSVQTGDNASSMDTFVVVTLAKDETLRGEIGCEVMLRVGTATCVSPSSPGLIDETDASTLESGKALVKNHLYMMTIDDRGVKATAANTKLLVRGGYTVS